jgi:hypothetical protein
LFSSKRPESKRYIVAAIYLLASQLRETLLHPHN